MSAHVVGVPEAQFHVHVNRLPIGLEPPYADSRAKERRPEVHHQRACRCDVFVIQIPVTVIERAPL